MVYKTTRQRGHATRRDKTSAELPVHQRRPQASRICKNVFVRLSFYHCLFLLCNAYDRMLGMKISRNEPLADET